MRIVTLLLFLTILSSACSSNKKTQQSRINASYDARTEAQRNAPTPGQRSAATPGDQAPASSQSNDARPATTSSAAPVRTVDGPTVSTGSVPTTKSAGEWVVTSIKGKFLAVDTSTIRVFMDLTAKTPTGAAVVDPAEFIQHFLIAYVMYPDYNNRER
ncbi:MAG: hypothetical protein JWP57_2311, partial [Spirosoma sp.]|nr:hypothetical protein [Spirosoma sp.]